jgi:hypothetical protein
MILSKPVYDISDAVSFTLPNHMDDTLKPDEFSLEQPHFNRATAGGRPLRWIERALNNAPELASLRKPFPDDPPLIYAYNHGRIKTAIEFALRGARWIPGRRGHRRQGASAMGRDPIAEGNCMAYAAEHPDGIAPERFQHCPLRVRFSIVELWEVRTTGFGLGLRYGDVGLVGRGRSKGRIAHDESDSPMVRELDSES